MKERLGYVVSGMVGALVTLIVIGGGIVLAAPDFSGEGLHIPDDKYLGMGNAEGVAADMELGWDLGNGRLELIDTLGNVMGYVTDAGTVGDWSITGGLNVTGAGSFDGAVTFGDNLANHVGTNDTAWGGMNLYGNATTSGGYMKWYTGGSHDALTNLIVSQIFNGVFLLEAQGGTNGTSDLLTWDLTSKLLSLPQNTSVTGDLRIAAKTPASASASGTTGTIARDASYIYICTATNTWKRVAIATW